MALSPCLLVLALSVAHAGGGDVARRPAVQVEELARPAAEVVEVETVAVEVVEVETVAVDASAASSPVLRSVVSFAVEGQSCAMTSVALSVCRTWLCSTWPEPEEFVRAAPHCPCLPPTELRWQAAPRRRWRRVVPPSSLPLFWLHERPPLVWPTPLDERPLGSTEHLCQEPAPTLLCGGVQYCLTLVVESPLHPDGSFDVLAVVGPLLADAATSTSSSAGATSSEAR